MKPLRPLILAWSRLNAGLAADVQRELRKQLVYQSSVIRWVLIPVSLLSISTLWSQLEHSLLLLWGTLTLLLPVWGLVNNRRNDGIHPGAFFSGSTGYHFFTGLVWGALPLLAALQDSAAAQWPALIITMGLLTALVLTLSASQRIFLVAFVPAGLLSLASLLLGPIYSLSLFLLACIYLLALILIHNTFFQVQVERVRSALRNAAHASALSNTLEHHDALTGLYNKAGLKQWLLLLRGGEDSYQSVCVALANVKGFSEINTLYGSSEADALLIDIATRLVSKAGDRIGLARLSGAEFLLVDAHPGADAEVLAQMLASLEHEDFMISERLVNISIQLSCVQGKIDDMENLIETARSCLPAQHSDNIQDSGSGADRLQLRRELVLGFSNALARQQIRPCFQPIVHCRSNAIIGWEALVRWQHPQLGEIMPEEFLDLARISGQATQLTRYVFHSAARFASSLMQHGYPEAAHISINFTASDLASASTLEWMLQTLGEFKLKAQQMTIEISEKEALLQDTRFNSNLLQIERAGLPLAIDDFGTGYANISHLLDLPAATVKLDKRFVDKLPHDKHSVALVRAIITMASSMGMRTIAEGVERTDQLEFLRDNNCDAYQGYLAGLAQPPEAALHLLAGWRSQAQQPDKETDGYN